MKRVPVVLVTFLATLLLAVGARAQQPPLLPEKTVSALAQELSGETAKRNLEFLARLHRQRGSRDFHTAAEFIAARARDYGLTDAHIEQFPADGKIFYGTQRSRPAWDADFAELWELRQKEGPWVPVDRLGDFQAMPVTLAEDSESADVTAELIDVGSGTSEQDYAGKDVRGKIVLVSAQPGGEVEAFAVEKFGAAGIVSYAQNQPNAWQGEDDNPVRWGHLDSFPKTPTFAFMVSLRTARALRDRLARGESIRLHAVVKAGRHPGFYDVATAVIPGADPKLRSQEIVFSCHLDHERPGANDNASGCVTILEVARTLQKLIAEDRIPRPARTIRFVWPAEVEGTLALLNGKPELVPHILAVVHMDMVGGGEVTKSIFHVTRAPMSLPTFLNDVAEAFGEFVNEQSYEFAATGRAAYPLVAPEGSKQALLAQFSDFTPGSDHDVYECGSYHIPAIYLNDWPDRYIHTNFDAAGNIDPTKLLRAAFIGGASGYFLASMGEAEFEPVLGEIEIRHLQRSASLLRRSHGLAAGKQETDEVAALTQSTLLYEAQFIRSIEPFIPNRQWVDREQVRNPLEGLGGIRKPPTGDGLLVFNQAPEPKGPLTVFGYDYFIDHFGADRARSLKIFRYEGLRGGGEDYAYETLNFADGKRNAQEIRDAVSAEYGPIPFADVLEYLRALESIGILQVKK
jgi:aminopeptidase YwaD